MSNRDNRDSIERTIQVCIDFQAASRAEAADNHFGSAIMTINSIQNSIISQQISQTMGITRTANQGIAEAGLTPYDRQHHHGKNELLNAVLQSLGQMGLNTQSATLSQTTGSTVAASTNKNAAAQALQTFIHDLLMAVQDQTGTTNSPDSSSYSSKMTSGIQDLIQALASDKGTTTTQSRNLNTLQNDFQHLVALMGTTSSGTGTVNLQTFLHNLDQNFVAANTSSNASGAFVNNTV